MCRNKQSEDKFYDAHEFQMVGAGVGGGFENTAELHIMNYDQAMATDDKPKWEESVGAEHDRMKANKVFTPKHIKDTPEWATVLSTTWSMKKKSNGTYRARMVARGFEQIDGEHYDEHDKSSPTVSEITTRICFVIMLMAGFWAEILDVCGAFLLGSFKPQHQMYIEIPKGFEKFYDKGMVLLLNKTLYGTKQAALQFWRLLLQAFKAMKYQRSKADACLQFKWMPSGNLMMWISWIDDCAIIGEKSEVKLEKERMKQIFECDDGGEMKEYIGVKLEMDRNRGWMRMTNPVIIQSFQDEFELSSNAPPNPAPAGSILKRGEENDNINKKDQKIYRSGVGKLLHVMRWSRPDILNRVRELSRYMAGATAHHLKEMHRVMSYCVATSARGWVLDPDMKWDGKDRNFEFIVTGKSDSDYAVEPDTRRSISGCTTFLCGAPVVCRSRMQKCVTLSVTEAEYVAGVECAQDMLFTMRVLESMGLKVKKPMILEIDNKGAVDLANNWSVAGRTRHVAARIAFLRELKEEGLILVQWKSSAEMSSDIFTKNVGGADFEKHAQVYVGKDEYM